MDDLADFNNLEICYQDQHSEQLFSIHISVTRS